jgi:hypothetical protein
MEIEEIVRWWSVFQENYRSQKHSITKIMKSSENIAKNFGSGFET